MFKKWRFLNLKMLLHGKRRTQSLQCSRTHRYIGSDFDLAYDEDVCGCGSLVWTTSM